ncbi:MAG: hypothetical protein ACKOQ1_02560, partial [Actinomycetota bacterium]
MSRTRDAEFENESDAGADGVPGTCARTPTLDWSGRIAAHDHCPVAAATVCPAVPARDWPERERHANDPEPPDIVMLPAAGVMGAPIPADARDSAMTPGPQSPACSAFMDRERQVHRPGAASISRSVGTEPVRTSVVPLDAHSSSHAVADAGIMPTCTLMVRAVVGGRGTTRGADGETTPSVANSLMNIRSVSPPIERVWTLAPLVKAAIAVHVVALLVHRVVPAA